MKTPDSIAKNLNQIFIQLGFSPVKAYYENSAFFLGWKIGNNLFELIYRLENDTLIICSLQGKTSRHGLENAMLPVMKLWQTVKENEPDIKQLKAMIRRTGGADSCAVRQKMVSYLQEQGARVFEDDNERWIELER